MIIDCGLHEGWSTTTLPKFDGEDPTITLNPDQGVLVINLMYVGVGIGSLAPMLMMDRIGRKWTLLFASMPKIFSWLGIAFANDYGTLYFARLLAGIGCGITYSVMPMYLGEISSKRTRGPLGTLIAVLINTGILLIYAIGLYVSRFTMAMISLVVPIVFVVTFIWLPETSVFLTRKNRLTRAERTLKWSLGKDDVEAELDEIKRIVAIEDENVGELSFLSSLREAGRTAGNRRAFGVAMIVLSCLTLTGAAPVLAYQAYIFQEAGFVIGSNISILTTGCAIVLAGITCVSLVRSVGKRTLLLLSAPLCVLALGTIATYFTIASSGVDVSPVNWIPTVFVVAYVIVYGLALNPVPLAYVGEIFAFEVKIPGAIFCSLYYAITTTATVKFYQVNPFSLQFTTTRSPFIIIFISSRFI